MHFLIVAIFAIVRPNKRMANFLGNAMVISIFYYWLKKSKNLMIEQHFYEYNKAEYSASDAPSSHLREGVTDRRPDGPTDGRTDGHTLL